MAAKISKRLLASRQWHDSDIGSAKILREVGAVGRFKTSVPDNGVWKGGVTQLLRNSVQIYIDGSKLNGAGGNEIFSGYYMVARPLQ